MLPRILTVDQRIRDSELFPRIRDAERAMIANEKAFRKSQKIKRKKEKKKREASAQTLVDGAIVAVENNGEVMMRKEYFTAFELNKDPRCSQYMPFDEVFFPKLFTPKAELAPPESINSLWLLAFEDHANRSVNKPVVKNRATQL